MPLSRGAFFCLLVWQIKERLKIHIETLREINYPAKACVLALAPSADSHLSHTKLFRQLFVTDAELLLCCP